ncbi:hypothetical protein ACE1CD_21140 [Aerosakkonema sp. BLCC-F183]|uniref:hypothetical protein n=1 Tax=Aerosakkonema sp. BLCC-F183 TaxID=3342834 RepID=UPI0035B926DF
MSKAGNDHWKTPLGVYERAIAEVIKTREEFQTELRSLRDIQASYDNLKSELQAAKQEIQNLQSQFQACQKELQETKAELEATKLEFQDADKQHEIRITEAKETADIALSEAKAANSKVESVKTEIENGTIVAQKALMLRGRNENYWMRFHSVDSVNHDVFQIWKIDDTWYDTIRVKAAKLLRARDDKHWMKFYRVDGKNRDVFAMWRSDKTWHDNIQLK